MISCKQASLMGTRATFSDLSKMERLKLSLHFKICTVCRDFAKENIAVDRAIKKIMDQRKHQKLSLTAAQRQKIITAIQRTS